MTIHWLQMGIKQLDKYQWLDVGVSDVLALEPLAYPCARNAICTL
jgi:hypothetical protein